MNNINNIEDIIKLILITDNIETDTITESNITIPIYDISAEEFLNYAKNSITKETKEDIINAISNLKRALDCKMDQFFESLNIRKIFKKNNLKFEQKTKFLSDIELISTYSINKLNQIRNKMEHEYKIQKINDLYTYYELVSNIIKTIDLYLELLYINGKINMTLNIKNNQYYFIVEYNIEECGFEIELIEWDKRPYGHRKTITIYLDNKESTNNFIKTFKLYFLTIQYFYYQNITLYKEQINKLLEKTEVLWND